MKKRNYTKYAFEFLSIFIAVISAFALNNWNENRREHEAEVKILMEIKNGLEKDIEDVRVNVGGHEAGIEACKYWNRLLKNDSIGLDSFTQHYFTLTRDFITIKNSSGYESLKSKGLHILKNDSLRYKIISFYEYDMQVVEKFEEEYEEMQYHKNYFPNINEIVAPHLKFLPTGRLNIEYPLQLNDKEYQLLKSYIWKIYVNRDFILRYYVDIEAKITGLIKEIEEEIQR